MKRCYFFIVAYLSIVYVQGMDPAQAADIKVFLMAGQSNMQGHGMVEYQAATNIQDVGNLRKYVETNPAKYGHLVDGNGAWVERSDVWVWGRQGAADLANNTLKNEYYVQGNLTPGYGANSNKFGPELGFGQVLGEHYDEQVVLVKTAWGGASLFELFRSPSSGGTTGGAYTTMVSAYGDALNDIAAQFPGQSVELVGFAWHQGFNDRLNASAVAEYESNLNNLIADLRDDLDAPNLKVVIGTTSMGSDSLFDPNNYNAGSPTASATRTQNLVNAQINVGEGDSLAFTVDTRDYWREANESPKSEGYHWNWNAETQYLIGESMGEAMVGLVPEPGSLALLSMGGLLIARRRRG